VEARRQTPAPPAKATLFIFFVSPRRCGWWSVLLAASYDANRNSSGTSSPSSADLVGWIAGVSPPPHEGEKIAAEEHLDDADAPVAEGPTESLSEGVDVVDAEPGVRAASKASCGGFVRVFMCGFFGSASEASCGFDCLVFWCVYYWVLQAKQHPLKSFVLLASEFGSCICISVGQATTKRCCRGFQTSCPLRAHREGETLLSPET